MARFFLPLIPDGGPDSVTLTDTTQELSVETYLTRINGTDGVACVATLPAGTKIGQLKKVAVADADSATSIRVTLTNHFSDSTDILDLDATGEFAVCQWQDGNSDDSNSSGAGWRVIETGSDAPATIQVV